MGRYLLSSLLPTLTITTQAEQSEYAHVSHVSHATSRGPQSVLPRQAGQSAFAAIQEIVSVLDAEPTTDWARVAIEALRRHLIDMNNVMLSHDSAASRLEDRMRYTIICTGSVRASIRRMVKAHAATMDGSDGWKFDVPDHPKGAVLTVSVSDPADLAKLRGLGFAGFMASGMHHQAHHLMIATGAAPHR